MNFRFPLNDVKIEIATEKKVVENPLFDDGFYRSSQNEFSIELEGVASYHVSNGNQIKIYPLEGATPEMIELFLNNWGVVGILHQRKILNFHSSSFNLNGNGIMVCGDSGAGKSSLTAAASLNGAQFLTDDITAVIFREGNPVIMPFPNRIALKEETITQLDLRKYKPVATNPFNQKNIFDFGSLDSPNIPLSHVLWINVHKKNKLEFSELEGLEKFTMLRGEICGWEMLNGMKETETIYMNQLLNISRNIRITKILRPQVFPLVELTNAVNGYLQSVK